MLLYKIFYIRVHTDFGVALLAFRCQKCWLFRQVHKYTIHKKLDLCYLVFPLLPLLSSLSTFAQFLIKKTAPSNCLHSIDYDFCFIWCTRYFFLLFKFSLWHCVDAQRTSLSTFARSVNFLIKMSLHCSTLFPLLFFNLLIIILFNIVFFVYQIHYCGIVFTSPQLSLGWTTF